MSKLPPVFSNVSRRLMSSSSPSSPFSVMLTRKADSEPSRRYEFGGYHPVNIGDIFNQRYQVVRKLGWGRFSTVWLVDDLREQRQVAMKVIVGKFIHSKTECDALKVLREQNPQAAGYSHICHLLDDFALKGPHGSHTCLVTEAMGATTLDLYRCISSGMPLFLVKRIAKHLLLALQYMHDCDIVHTDVKGDNIFMNGTPPPIYPDIIRMQEDELMEATFKLSDLGSANKMSNRFAPLIQPEALRSPEVILGAEWDTKVDIWNFGCLMYEFMQGVHLFDPYWQIKETEMSRYQTHLAQMVGLLGDFPQVLLDRAKNARDYFDEKGQLLHGAGQYGTTLQDLLSKPKTRRPEDVSIIADFLSHALTIDPEKRWSASRLLQHPWVKDVI